MTDVYLFRHGIAVEIGERGVQTDYERMLSAEGIKKTPQVVAGMKALGIRPEVVASSPLIRAAETAAIAADKLTPGQDVVFTDTLKPGTDPQETLAWLQARTEQSIMLVGHNPHLEALAALLLTPEASAHLHLRKAGVCHLRLQGPAAPGTGCLECFLRPKLMRAIGKKDVGPEKCD